MKLSQNLKLAIDASLLAGKKILEIYTSDDFIVEYKSDESPLTLADKSSNEIIKNVLKVSNFPILSEEGEILDYNKRKDLNHLETMLILLKDNNFKNLEFREKANLYFALGKAYEDIGDFKKSYHFLINVILKPRYY